MEQQTALEFLLTELDIAKLIAREKLTMAAEVVRQAKQMEKKHIIEAYCDGFYQGSKGDRILSEEYINETYMKNNVS